MNSPLKLLNNKLHDLGFLFLLVLFSAPTYGLTYKISSNENTVGQPQTYIARSGDTLLSIGHHFDIGAREMAVANPRLRQYIRAGAVVNIPSRFKLPTAARQGIILNLAEMRVYFFHPDGETVSTYPVGIGRQGWSTPMGATSITNKVRNPSWHPPASIRREAARRGKTLPLVVRPGPRNPLGRYAMHLGFKGILMHGTTSPYSIGLRSSHGCIRMFNKDIQELFGQVPVGTPVRIVYEPTGKKK